MAVGVTFLLVRRIVLVVMQMHISRPHTRTRARPRARTTTDEHFHPYTRAGEVLGLLPEALEPMPRDAGVMGRVLGIAVAEVILHRAQIGALVGEIIAAGVPKHVRPHFAELGLLAGLLDDVVDCLASELCPALRDEQTGQPILSRGQIALNGPELVAGDRLLN